MNVQFPLRNQLIIDDQLYNAYLEVRRHKLYI